MGGPMGPRKQLTGRAFIEQEARFAGMDPDESTMMLDRLFPPEEREKTPTLTMHERAAALTQKAIDEREDLVKMTAEAFGCTIKRVAYIVGDDKMTYGDNGKPTITRLQAGRATRAERRRITSRAEDIRKRQALADDGKTIGAIWDPNKPTREERRPGGQWARKR